jgi:hypothetical protein
MSCLGTKRVKSKAAGEGARPTLEELTTED